MIKKGRSYLFLGDKNTYISMFENMYDFSNFEKLTDKDLKLKVIKCISRDWVKVVPFQFQNENDERKHLYIHVSKLKDKDGRTELSMDTYFNISSGWKKMIDQNPKRTIRVVVVGCGGTGSWVVRDLARLARTYNENTDLGDMEILLIDGDKVELKNTIRQNFIISDVNQYKAEVLAKRYGKAFGVNISYMNQYLKDRTDLDDFKPDAILGCVDNDPSRSIIKDIMNRRQMLWIDSGNEKSAGQVVISNSIIPRRLDSPISDLRKDYLSMPHSRLMMHNINGILKPKLEDLTAATPTIHDLFPFNKEDRHPENASCAENAISAPQDMFINNMAATIMINVLGKILFGQPLYYYLVFFSLNNVVQPVMASYNNLVNKSTSTEL